MESWIPILDFLHVPVLYMVWNVFYYTFSQLRAITVLFHIIAIENKFLRALYMYYSIENQIFFVVDTID